MGWTKSTRSVLAVMAFGLLYLIVVIAAGLAVIGKEFPIAILTFVAGNITGVTTAYFGRRDSDEERKV